jgi:hypothetical protein
VILYFVINLCILLDLKALALSEVIQHGTPKRYMICRSRKLMTLSELTSLNGIASAHLEKYAMATRIMWCPLVDGGSMAPMTSIPEAPNGHDRTVGWRGTGGRCWHR